MAASDHLNKILFHGTGGEIHGGVVKPGAELGVMGRGAYATTALKEAEHYAGYRATIEGRLFGTVYEVSPVSDNPNVYEGYGHEYGDSAMVVDDKGLKVNKAVSYPINWDIDNNEDMD
jgi:hypothetical protein